MVLELLGVPEGEGPLFTAQNEEGSVDSSKTEGTPPGRGHFGVMFWTPDVAHTFGVYDVF